MANALARRTLTTDTTIVVVGPIQNAPNGGVIEIDSEIIFFGHATDTAYLDCIRGFASTIAAIHNAGAVVTNISDTPQATVTELVGDTAPVDGITGVGLAPTGSRYTRSTNGTLFLNTGTLTAPVWTLVDAGITSGISALTGDVTAGPGSGSQVASVAFVGGKSAAQVATAVDEADAAISSLTGDVTASGPGAAAATLADTTVTPGPYTNADITIDSKGRITAAANGSGATPGGSNRDIQFNDSGALGGNDHLKFLNDEEVAIFGAANSNLSLNHDTAAHVYFNNTDQSITFASLLGDGSGLTFNVNGFVNQFKADGGFTFANGGIIYDSSLDRTQFNDIILEGKLYGANPIDLIPSAGPEHWVVSKGEIDQFNDAGGSLVFNNFAGSQTFVNLTADTDHSLRITGNNNLAKFAISDGYVVFGVNNLAQDGSSVFTVHGSVSLGELSLGGNIAHDFGELAIGSSLADPSAILDVVSTSRGFAPPRMTTTQKNAIASPVEGLVVYDTTLHKLSVRTVATWETVTSV